MRQGRAADTGHHDGDDSEAENVETHGRIVSVGMCVCVCVCNSCCCVTSEEK